MEAYHYPAYSPHWLLHGSSVLVSLVLVLLTLLASLGFSMVLILVSTVPWAASFLSDPLLHISSSEPHLCLVSLPLLLHPPCGIRNIFFEVLCDQSPFVL